MALTGKGGQRVSKAIGDTKDVIAAIKEQIADVERTMPEAPSRGDIQTGGGRWAALKYGLGFGDDGGKVAREKLQAYNDAQQRLKNYQKMLQQNEDTFLKLNDAERENAKLIAEKKTAFERLLDAVRKLPAPEASPTATLAQTAAASMIDPLTGGIAYHPPQYNALQYKPLKGAPGFVDPLAAAAPVVSVKSDLKSMDEKLGAMLEAMTKAGIKIIPEMGK